MNKEEYNNEGYTIQRQLFTIDQINKMNQIIDNLLLQLKVSDKVFDENGTGLIKQIQFLHHLDSYFESIIDQLKPFVEYLIGDRNLNVLNMQLFEKHPFISKPTRSHQDNAYFKMTPATPLTVWISLDDINEENGCIYYAPKTHLTPTRKHQRYHPHTTFRVRSGVPGLSLCLHEHPEETDIPMITNKGDVLFHNCNTIHRAGKNTSNRRRRAIGVVFIPTVCTIDPLLEKYHQDRLKEDIELQKIKNPKLYEQLISGFL
jgi:phytanoyl-CoA hydroxylase